MRNNFSTFVYGNKGGSGPAMCASVIIVSWPAGSMIKWMQCAHVQSPWNALCIKEMSK